MDGGSAKDLSNRGRRRSNSRDRQGTVPVGRRDSFESVSYDRGNGEEVSIRGATEWCGDEVCMSTLVALSSLSSVDRRSVAATTVAVTAHSNMVAPRQNGRYFPVIAFTGNRFVLDFSEDTSACF